MSLAFLLCVERGPLEDQSVLLCRSIRRWAGAFADAPIHAYRPREGPGLSERGRRELDGLEVFLHEEPLNREFVDYPMGNKMFACLAAQSQLGEDVLVFCDSDSVFTGEPADLALSDDVDVAARPVGNTGRGSEGAGHEHEPYWRTLYELAGVEGEGAWVETANTGERIRGYWNGGLLAVRRASGIYGEWLDLFRLLIAEGHMPKGSINNMDQLALAGTLARRPDRVGSLDYRYNYPIPQRAELPGSQRTADLDELIHIHYHRWFNRPGFLGLLQPPLGRGTEQYRWLEGHLPLEPTIDEPLHGQEPPGYEGREGRRRLKAEHGTRKWSFGLAEGVGEDG